MPFPLPLVQVRAVVFMLLASIQPLFSEDNFLLSTFNNDIVTRYDNSVVKKKELRKNFRWAHPTLTFPFIYFRGDPSKLD